jgi:Ca-activated chloride channel family protein
MFQLAEPLGLFGLLLPFLIWFLLPALSEATSMALRIPFFQGVVGVLEQNKYKSFRFKEVLFPFCIWSLLIFAACGPRFVGEPEPLAREGYNIMLALDLSESMEIRDMVSHNRPVSRLSIVKRAAEQFINMRNTDKFGLILFGSQAYLQTPLTYDRSNVLQRIEDATVGLAGKTTSIGDALGLAVKRLQNVPPKGRIIILLTDGANNSGVLKPLKAAELAQSEGIKVYTIGLGAEGAQASMMGGFIIPNASADLDEDTLKEVAQMTKGQYFRATDTDSLSKIYETIHKLERVEQEQQTIRPQKELYPWVLALALGLFSFWLIIKFRLKEQFPVRFSFKKGVEDAQ